MSAFPVSVAGDRDQSRRADLSVVIISHDHRALVQANLPSFFSPSPGFLIEVLVIDNTGQDGLAPWIRQHWPQVALVCNPRPLSYAENVNQSIGRHTLGRYVAVLNPDVRGLPGLLPEAIAFMDANPDVGIMGPQLLNTDGTIQASCRRFSTPLVTLIRGLHLDGMLRSSRPVSRYLMSDFGHDRMLDVDWITGACMIARRQAVETAGGMDERYRGAYSEDQDWCCQMWRAGWRVCYVPQARAVHDLQRMGMRRPWSKMGYLQTVNAVRMFHKYGWRLSRGLPGRPKSVEQRRTA
jgi:N-acetylglucosaminyl-diphospho-decaprenol L-rhamnosyltransferase